MFKRWLGIGLFVLAALTGGGSAFAETLPSVPHGIALTGDSAVLMPPTAGRTHVQFNRGQSRQLVTLTTGAHQFGAVWSTNDDAFRLGHNQTIGAWVNFGPQAATSEGLAFVLQNDARTINARPDFGTTPIGETLGVFGVANEPYQASAGAVSRTAIQKSWALSLVNTPHQLTGTSAPGRADSFGVAAPKAYVAASYPGAAATYQPKVIAESFGGLQLPNRYAYQLAQQGVLATTGAATTLADGQWHHVTIRWCAATRKMTYAINDRRSLAGADVTEQKRTVHVDLNQVDPAHTGYARWGFTTTTGKSALANPALVLTQVPQRQQAVKRSSKTVASKAKAKAATLFHVQVPSLKELNVTPHHPAKIQGQVTAPHRVTGITIQGYLLGHLVATAPIDAQGRFELTLKAAQVQPGTRKLHLKVRVPGRASRTVAPTLAVNRTGQLTFTALSTASGFRATAVTAKSTLVPRQAGWRIEVQDTRGTGKRWALMVQAQPLVNRVTKRPMAGSPVFVKGHTVTPLGTSPTVIMTHITDERRAQGKTNILAHWSKYTGILLRAQPGTEIGHYQGTLRWTLTNAPQ